MLYDTFHFIRKFQFKSVLVKSILLLLTLSIIISTFFSFLLIRTINRKNMEYWSGMCMQYTETLTSNAEYMLKSLHQSLTQLAISQNILSLAYDSYYDCADVNKAKFDFYHAGDCNDLISVGILYVPKINLILDTGSYNEYSLETYPNNSLIYKYQQCKPLLISFNGVENFSNLFLYDNQLVIARDFPINGENRLATIFYLVDNETFYGKLCDTQFIENSHVWVFDREQTPLFNCMDSEDAEYALSLLSSIKDSGDNSQITDDTLYFLTQSDKLHWQFLYQAENPSSTPLQTSAASVLWPVILITFAIFVLAILSAYQLYRPLHSLLSAVEVNEAESDASASPVHANEFDYLSHNYELLLEQRKKTDTLIANVATDIIEHLFLDLFSDMPITDSDISLCLRQVQEPFLRDDLFKVVVLQFATSDSEDEKRHLFLASLRDSLSNHAEENHCLIYQTEPNLHITALSLVFTKETSFVLIQKCVSALHTVIRNLTENNRLVLGFGVGHLCSNLLDTPFSYHEARANAEQNLHEQQHSAFSQERSFPEEATFSPANRATQVIETIHKEKLAEAVTLSNRIIDDIFKNQELPVSNKLASYKLYISSLYSQIAPFITYTEAKGLPGGNPSLSPDAASGEVPVESMKETCAQALQAYAKVLSRRQNKYLVAAKIYLDKHFTDTELTLYSCAEQVDTSPSYLSRLFKTIENVKFNEYLNQLRINHSTKLLRESNLTITEIAEASGFNSAQSYIRVFKSYMGETPGAYRNRR